MRGTVPVDEDEISYPIAGNDDANTRTFAVLKLPANIRFVVLWKVNGAGCVQLDSGGGVIGKRLSLGRRIHGQMILGVQRFLDGVIGRLVKRAGFQDGVAFVCLLLGPGHRFGAMDIRQPQIRIIVGIRPRYRGGLG